MSADESTKELFSEALEQPVGEREAFLERACAGDAGLRARINRLLDAHGGGGKFLAARAKGPEPVWAGPAREKPGDAVGPYKLLQEIGEGGFGVVFMAEQKTPVVRRVALKILKAGMDTRQVIARFEAERQALAMMDHSGIARVFDAGATAVGRPYFVMELVRGEPITSFCDTQQMDVRRRLELFQQVCHAVQHAHQKGIIHRDIKPSNILVAAIDGHATPKIIDFGIAKATGSAGGTATQLTDKTIFTDFRQFIGTPEYMSPEQAGMGAIDVDTRSDIYSLGVLLYELLTGAPPFDPEKLRSAEWDEMRRIIREDEPERPSTRLHALQTTRQVAAQRRTELARLIGSIRGDLDWIVMKCLEKDRSRRYETASSLAMDIARHLNGEPVLAAPPSTVYRVGKFVRRNRARVLAGSLVALSLMGAVAGTTTFAVREARQRARAERLAENNKLIAEFQGNMLKGIKVPRMGQLLREDILADAQEAWGRLGVSSDEIARRGAQLKAHLDDVNFTDMVTRNLDRSLFERALTTLDAKVVDPLAKAAVLQDLADTLRGLSVLDRAMVAQERALQIRIHELGNDDPDTLTSLLGKGLVLREQGRAPEAVRYAREALVGRRRAFGPDDPRTWEATHLLAYSLNRQNKEDESEPLVREMLDRQRRILGENDPQTLESVFRLGCAIFYREDDRFSKAAELIEASAAGLRRVLREDDEKAIKALAFLGMMIRDEQGRFAEAEQILREVLPVMHRELGDDSWTTWDAELELGNLLRKEGRLVDAESLIESAVRHCRRIRGNDDLQTLYFIGVLAQLRLDQERLAEAEAGLREARAGFDLLKRDDMTLSLARVLDLTGDAAKSAQADELRRKTIKHYEATFGPGDRRTLEHLGWIAWNLYLSNRIADAEPWARRALDGLQALPREASSGVRNGMKGPSAAMMNVLGILATIVRDNGRPVEALPLFEKFQELYRDTGEGLHLLGIETWIRHAECLARLGRFAAAEHELDELSTAVFAQGHRIMPSRVIKAYIRIYDDWHAAEPGGGHNAQAAEWRERLPSVARDANPPMAVGQGG